MILIMNQLVPVGSGLSMSLNILSVSVYELSTKSVISIIKKSQC